MSLTINPDVIRAIDPPIAEAQSWIAGRTFPDDKPLLDLAQAVPSYPPADALSRHLAERTAAVETARYTPIAGIPDLRASLAEHMSSSHGGSIGPENVLISAGCNQAYCLAILALARAGDQIILPIPYYFNHMMWLQMQGIEGVALPFRADRGGVPDPDQAAELVTERTRAIVLVSPNNPTGAVYPAETIAAFRDLAAQRGIALIVDETYKDFLDDGPPHDLFRDERWGDTVIQLYSFSKAFSLPGYRVGSVIAGEKTIAAVTKVMDTISICAPRIAQDAALFGLNNLADWVAEKRAMINGRRDAVRKIFRSNDLGYGLISSGAYFAYVRHPFQNHAARDVARRNSDEPNNFCLPGTFFGHKHEQCFRHSYANATAEEMPVLADRLKASL